MLSQAIVAPQSAPGSTTVVTLSRVKSAPPVGLGISDTSQDVALKALIRACYQAFAGPQGLRRDFSRRTWKVRTPGFGGVYLPLPLWPIESVSSVTEGVETPAMIDAADYEIADPDRQSLYRLDGWLRSQQEFPGLVAAGGDPLDYTVDLIAGWLMPDEVLEWSAGLVVANGQYVRSSSPSLFLFQAGSAGTMTATEPTWPTALGGNVVNNGITFTARAARRLPDEIEELALFTVKEWYGGGLELPAGVVAESFEGGSISYDTSAVRGGSYSLPPAVRGVLAGYR